MTETSAVAAASGGSPPRPIKRRRSEEPEEPFTTQDDRFWFADGSIVLISEEKTGFRVHLSVLASHCQYFKDMVQHAQPTSAGESVQLLPLSDSSEDISHFLRFFYEMFYFTCGRVTPYRKLAALLRLSTKYLCDPLRKSVINHLSLIYTPNRRILRQASHALIPAENKDDHGLLAVQMARENNIPGTILPIALYFASTMDPTALLEYPDVSTEIKLSVSTGRARLSAAVLQTAWHHVSTFTPQPAPGCKNGPKCCAGYLVAMQEILAKAPYACRIFLEPYPYENRDARSRICNVCCTKWTEAEQAAYGKVWNELPSYFGLDPWPSK